MKIAMGLLAALAVVGGALQIPGVDHVIRTSWRRAWPARRLRPRATSRRPATAWIGLIIGAVIGAVGITLAYVIYVARPGTAARFQAAVPWLHKFLVNKWYFDEAIDLVVVRPVLAFGRFAESVLERIVIAGGVTGGVTGAVALGLGRRPPRPDRLPALLRRRRDPRSLDRRPLLPDLVHLIRP